MTAKEIKRTLQSEFVRTLRKPFVDAVKAYELVKPSDKVAVCISGGKDSMLLALLLQDLQHTMDFDLVFLAMDPGYAPAGRKHLEVRPQYSAQSRTLCSRVKYSGRISSMPS